MRTFDDVFTAFGGPARLAEAIGIEPFHAQTMKTRGNIPAGYFVDVAAAAEQLTKEGRGELEWVTVEALAAIAKDKLEARGRKAEPAEAGRP